MEKNKIIYSEILCVFAFSLMPACSCRLCLCQMEGFIREVEILENRTNRMFGMGLVVMGIIASYFCESSGFSYIYAVLAALSGGVLIGYRTALHILTAGIVWICRIPPIHEALKKRAVNGGKGYRIGEDGIYLVKECNAHGKFQTLIWEGNAADYLSWGRENLSAETPVNPKVKEKSCPDNCGLCEEHERKGCCMILEVTKRCNMHCPVCFASAGEGGEKGDLSICEIEKQYDFLMAHGGPFNIQLSGGEPTMRDDLPEIIHMGREKGFTFFQLNTNGIRLAREEGYAGKLKKAGLNTVFLQFDGVTDQVYETLRGQAMMELKKKAVLNCSEAELGIALVPVIAPGVNDMQVGDILKFGLDHMPFVRGVHFQPISYFGRCSQKRPQNPITIPKMLRLIEEQTEGLMKIEDFAGGGAENPYCSFHASYLRKGEQELKLLEKKSGKGCCCTTSDDSRQYVENQWSYSTKTYDEGEMTQTDALDEFLIRIHNETFAVSGMIFQDAWNLDLDRLKRCYICEVDPDHGMVPFCAYNLTNLKGTYLYRK